MSAACLLSAPIAAQSAAADDTATLDTARPSPLDSAQLSRAARQPPPEEPH